MIILALGCLRLYLIQRKPRLINILKYLFILINKLLILKLKRRIGLVEHLVVVTLTPLLAIILHIILPILHIVTQSHQILQGIPILIVWRRVIHRLLLVVLLLLVRLLVNICELIKVLVLSPALNCLIISNNTRNATAVRRLVHRHTLNYGLLWLLLGLAIAGLVGGDHRSLS